MKTILFSVCQFASRLFLGVAVVALSLVVVPSVQAQTNYDFNASTDYGWQQWLPEWYVAVDPCYTNAINLPSVTSTTNDYSAGNMAYFLHAGTSNSTQFQPMIVGSFITNGTPLADFTMTAEFFHWTNGQGQEFGLAGRVQLPLAPVNPPPMFCGDSSSTSSYAPTCITLVYANARSAKNFNAAHPSGSTDNLRIDYVFISPFGAQSASVIASASFSGPGADYTAGRSLSPDAMNGNYRLILTAVSGANGGFTNGGFTGQIVDLSTGLPMQMGSAQNMITTRAYYSNYNALLGSYVAYLTNNGAIYTNGVLSSATVPLGSAYGLIATLGSSGSTVAPTNLTDFTICQPIDPKFDNFAIVPGVVTLESASVVTGPYAQDTTAGIEVNPKRITVPVNGVTRFYRLNWIGCDHTPTITGITPGPTVNVVLASGATTTVTNAVATVVLGYN